MGLIAGEIDGPPIERLTRGPRGPQ